MRNFITALLLVFTLSSLNAQIKGIPAYSSMERADTSNGIPENVWFQYDDENYLMYFGSRATPLNVRDAIKEAYRLCDLNGWEFDRPNIEDSYLDSTVNGYHDYSSLSMSVNIEYSRVNKKWFTDKETIGLVIRKDIIAIMIHVMEDKKD